MIAPAPCPGGYGCTCTGVASRGRPTVRVEWRHFEDAAIPAQHPAGCQCDACKRVSR